MTVLARVESVGLRLGARDVLHDVSLEIAAGDVVALVGPNGAGKSSLIKVLAGLLAATRGSVFFDGKRLGEMPVADRARAIAYLPQARDIHWPLAVRDIVALGRLPHQMAGMTTIADDRAAITAAMMQMDVTAHQDRPVLELSGGEQARVLMARALAQESRLLLADEPTAGLDLAHQLALMDVFCARAEVGGASVVALHDLALAARVADRVVLMTEGRIVAAGSPDEVLTEALIGRVFGVPMQVVCVDGAFVFVPRVAGAT
jgi:iron complex transport system ATP-binding protein